MTAARKKVIDLPAPTPCHGEGTCPAFTTLGLIANKWSVKILYTLIHSEDKPLRFGEIQKSLGNITQRELTKHLREFEKAGLVSRMAFAQVPPRAEYKMTTLGMSLRVPMDALSDWANTHGKTIAENRKKARPVC